MRRDEYELEAEIEATIFAGLEKHATGAGPLLIPGADSVPASIDGDFNLRLVARHVLARLDELDALSDRGARKHPSKPL